MTDPLDPAVTPSQTHTASCAQTWKQQLSLRHVEDSPHDLPKVQYTPPHQAARPPGHVHVCYSESDEQLSHAVIRELKEHGHDVTDCERTPVPGEPELKQMAALVQSAVWVVVVVSLAALDSIWLNMQLHWTLDVAVDRGMCHMIVLLQPDVTLPRLLDFFPQICTVNEEWMAELLSLLSSRPKTLTDSHRRLLEEQIFLCGPQAQLWPSLSTPSLDRAFSQESLDSKYAVVTVSSQTQRGLVRNALCLYTPKVSGSLWSRFLQRTRRSLFTSRNQAVASLKGITEVSNGRQTPNDKVQHLVSGEHTAELQTEGAVHFLHTEEDEALARDVKDWLEREGVSCTDSGLSVRPGVWELPQLQNLVTCAAWVVVMVTLGSLDSAQLDFLCQVACVEAMRRGSGNVVVVLTHPRLHGLLPQVLSPFPNLVVGDEVDWRSRLKELVTSCPLPLSRDELSRQIGLQGLWKAASAWSLERPPAWHLKDGASSRPILPLWSWPSFASRQRKAQLETASKPADCESSAGRSNDDKKACDEHTVVDIVLDEKTALTSEHDSVLFQDCDTYPIDRATLISFRLGGLIFTLYKGYIPLFLVIMWSLAFISFLANLVIFPFVGTQTFKFIANLKQDTTENIMLCMPISFILYLFCRCNNLRLFSIQKTRNGVHPAL